MTSGTDGLHPPVEFNPLLPHDSADPYEKLRSLRDECPVAHIESGGLPPFVLVTKHSDVGRVFRDWHTFSNRLGVGIHPESHLEVPFEDRSLLLLDPPEHSPIRRIMLSAVSRAAVTRAVPYIEDLCARTVEAFAGRGEAELVTEWASVIPATTITHMVGVPEEDHDDFRRWTAEHVADIAVSKGQRSNGARGRFVEYLQHQIDVRRSAPEPPDDIITRMMHLRGDNGEALTDRQICTQIQLLIMAGNETTTNLMANAMQLAITEQGLYERLRGDLALVPKLVEETLRFDPPVQYFPRFCERDADVGAARVSAGEVVVLSMASANRDEEAWGPDAGTFDVDRERGMAEHFAFGLGPHFCLGAALAREQARIAIEALIGRIPHMTLAEHFRYEKVDYQQFRGPKRLPVTFRRC